jgi:predicted permease
MLSPPDTAFPKADTSGVFFMAIIQEFRAALRALAHDRGRAAVAILVLALGLGANTAMFSVIHAALVRPLPFSFLREPERLVAVYEKQPSMMAYIAGRVPVALGNLRAWRRDSRLLEGFGLFQAGDCHLGVQSGRTRKIECAHADAAFFSTLGVTPAAGRLFNSAEARDGSAVLVSTEYFEEQFGRDGFRPGRAARVDGVPRQIVGLLPRGFTLPAAHAGDDQKRPVVWLPATAEGKLSDEQLWARDWWVFARLRPGATLPAARAEMDAIATRQRAAFPAPNRGFGVNVFSLRDEDMGAETRRALLLLQAAVGFVLLIACANLAHLMLARAVARRREMAIRAALGAGRARIARLLLLESLILSLAGGVLGTLLAWWALDLIPKIMPGDTHVFTELRINPMVIGFTFLCALASALLFGLLPALSAGRLTLNETLGQGGRATGGGPRWLRGTLVAGEIALAVVLLAGAGLMIRSVGRLMQVDLGYRTSGLITANIHLRNSADSGPATPEQARLHARRLLEAVRRLPGVDSASVSSGLPMESVSEQNYILPGITPRDAEFQMANSNEVSEDFFSTLGVRLLGGRTFSAADVAAADARVMIVSDLFARAAWPGRPALGQTVQLGRDSQDLPYTVVGVVAATRQMGPDSAPRPELYLPARGSDRVNLAVHARRDAAALSQAVERVVNSIDPRQPAARTRLLRQVLGEWPEERLFLMRLLSLYAGLALALVAVGLYGVLAYTTGLRRREFGLRSALGATRVNLVALVGGQALRLAAAGLAVGLAGALALAQVMREMIYGISPFDLWALGGAVLAVTAVALASSSLPALRAARVEPVEALHTD